MKYLSSLLRSGARSGVSWSLILLGFCLTVPAVAEDWTVDGKDYHNVKVGQIEADRVHISDDGGIGTVMIADLTPDLKKRFNYDPGAAKQATQERAQQASQADAELAAEMRQNAKADTAQAQQDKSAAQAGVSADKAQADADAKAQLKVLQQDYEQKVSYADSHHGAGGKEEGEARKRLKAYEAWMWAQGLPQ